MKLMNLFSKSRSLKVGRHCAGTLKKFIWMVLMMLSLLWKQKQHSLNCNCVVFRSRTWCKCVKFAVSFTHLTQMCEIRSFVHAPDANVWNSQFRSRTWCKCVKFAVSFTHLMQMCEIRSFVHAPDANVWNSQFRSRTWCKCVKFAVFSQRNCWTLC